MKVRIERDFIDKYTQEMRKAGSIVEFEDERAAELLADPRNVVSQIDEKEGQEPKKAAAKPKAATKAAPKKKAVKK